MGYLNRVILMGNLTRDPDLRVTSNGNSICKISIALNRSYKLQDGTTREETTFVDVDVFGKQAEVVSKYFNKGKPILLEGRLRFDTWETNNGEKRSKLNVVMENFQFVGGRSESDEGPGNNFDQSSPPRRESKTPPSQVASNTEIDDDDVPF